MGGAERRRAAVRRLGAGREARAGAHDVRAPTRSWLARLRPGVEGLDRALAALPVYRTYIAAAPARPRTPPCCARPASRTGSRARRSRSSPASSSSRRRSWPRASRTPRSTATRGCSRCATSAATRAASRSASTRFHAGNAARAERFPLHMLTTQTHDTKRSGDVRARLGALAGMAHEWSAAVRRWRGLCAPLRRRRRAGRRRAVHDLPDARRRVAARARPPVRLHAQGDARGEDPHELDRAGRAPRGGRARLLPRALRPRPVPRGLRAVRGARGGGGRADRAAPDGAQADRPRRARHLPGRRARVARRWSIPTTAGPSTGTRRRVLLARLREGIAATGPDERKLALVRDLLALRARRPDAFTGSYEPLDAGPDAVAFVRGGAVAVVVPVRGRAAAPGLPPGRLGARRVVPRRHHDPRTAVVTTCADRRRSAHGQSHAEAGAAVRGVALGLLATCARSTSTARSSARPSRRTRRASPTGRSRSWSATASPSSSSARSTTTIATGVWPDMTEHGWERDDWPDDLRAGDGAPTSSCCCTPIWLGEKSSVCTQVIERLYGNSHLLNERGPVRVLRARRRLPHHRQRGRRQALRDEHPLLAPAPRLHDPAAGRRGLDRRGRPGSDATSTTAPAARTTTSRTATRRS